MAILTLTVGILATLASLSGLFSFIGVPLGGVGLALSLSLRARALRTKRPTGLLSAAVALNVAGLLIGFATHTACERVRRDTAAENPKLSREFEETFEKAIRSHERPADGAP